MDFGEFDEKNLFQIRKIWDIEVAVLNERLAREHKLIK